MKNELKKEIGLLINDPKLNNDQLLGNLQSLVYDFANKNTHCKETQSLLYLYEKNKPDPEIASKNIGIHPGFESFKEAFGSFLPGEFIVVIGRPGMGKLSLLVNLAINISKKVPVAFFTLDLSAKQLTQHILSSITEIPFENILGEELNETRKHQLNNLQESLSHKLFINESHKISLDTFKILCIQKIKEDNCKVILVDYLQLMRSFMFKNGKKATISDICELLKDIAKENKVCIIVSSQLSRSVELRSMSFGRPELRDLGERGVIEQLADKVLFLYRLAYYGLTEDEFGHSAKNVAEVIIAKNKYGKLGRINLFYDPIIRKFKDNHIYISDRWKDEDDFKIFE